MIIGLDVGSRRVASCQLLTSPVFSWYESPETDPAACLKDIQWWIQHTLQYRNAAHDVWLETVQVTANPQTALRQCLTLGMLMATLGGTLISPTTWKAQILGYGHARKEDIADWVRWTSPSSAQVIQEAATRADRRQDLYDAYCIALYGDFARRRADLVDDSGSLSEYPD